MEVGDVVTDSTHGLQVTERYRASRDRMLRLLDELVESGSCQQTAYLSSEATIAPAAPSSSGELAELLPHVLGSDTGAVLFWCDDRVWAVVPPFPVGARSITAGADTAPLAELLGRELHVGVVLLRLGRYAVGVLRGDRLLASKSDSRYVKSRHRAGGSSQRRFERSRQRLVRELFDKACQVTGEVFAPFDDRIDYLLLGGERHTLQQFTKRCPLLQRPVAPILRRRLDVQRPGRAALEQLHREVWQSRVVVLKRDGPG